MRGQSLVLGGLCGALLLVQGSGCAIVGGAFNENFFSQLGFDTSTIYPNRGTIIVVFDNQTQFNAQFFAFESPSTTDVVTGSRNFNSFVAANANRNEVMNCPVELLTPGTLTDQDLDLVGAVVFDADTGTDVNYEGPVLFGGSDFLCGDVVSITLFPALDGYGISVQVRRGQ